MFIDNLTIDPVYYFTVVISVTASIVLHELAHGVVAILQGDDTPIVSGHMTWNPLVHMGATGLGLLCIAGIAFGAMPIDRSRFRGRHGDALVAVAGPLMNAVLAVGALTALGLLIDRKVDPLVAGVDPLWILGLINAVLCLFNLIPIAPLDGASVLASFVPGYRDFMGRPENAKYGWIAFGLVFLLAGKLFELGSSIAGAYVGWVARV